LIKIKSSSHKNEEGNNYVTKLATKLKRQFSAPPFLSNTRSIRCAATRPKKQTPLARGLSGFNAVRWN